MPWRDQSSSCGKCDGLRRIMWIDDGRAGSCGYACKLRVSRALVLYAMRDDEYGDG